MHVLEFFQRIEMSTDDAKAARTARRDLVRAHIRRHFLADEAFDQYFAGLLEAPLCQAASANYVLSSVLNFGVHQLTMRQGALEGCQRFVQVGCLDGHELACAARRNVATRIDLVCPGGRPPTLDGLLNADPEPWAERPRVFEQTLRDYLEGEAPCIGLLALVAAEEPEQLYATLRACWPRLHVNADVILQGDPTVITRTVQRLNAERPELRGHAAHSTWLDGDEEREQMIAVVQRTPHVYHELVERLQDYGPGWDDAHLSVPA